jgi:hypothetical protein
MKAVDRNLLLFLIGVPLPIIVVVLRVPVAGQSYADTVLFCTDDSGHGDDDAIVPSGAARASHSRMSNASSNSDRTCEG